MATPTTEGDVQAERSPGRVSRTVSKAAEHLQKRQEIRAPLWLVYVVLGVALLALGYGIVQQFRIVRWRGMLTASKEYIAQLEAKVATARYLGIKQATTRAIKKTRQREKKLDGKLSTLKKREQAITKKVQKMTPEELKKAFEKEGF